MKSQLYLALSARKNEKNQTCKTKVLLTCLNQICEITVSDTALILGQVKGCALQQSYTCIPNAFYAMNLH